jgi:hypothetical protein
MLFDFTPLVSVAIADFTFEGQLTTGPYQEKVPFALTKPPRGGPHVAGHAPAQVVPLVHVSVNVPVGPGPGVYPAPCTNMK